MPTPRLSHDGPSSGSRISRKRLAWVGITAVALGAGAYWALVPKGGDGRERAAEEVSDEAPPSGAASSSAAEWAQLRRTLEGLAPGDAMPAARKQALDALPAASDPSSKISVLLSAIDGDPAEAEQDPMWTDLVQAVAGLWSNDTLAWGLKLMHAEARPKARRAVISSLARMAASERAARMAPEHRELLQNNLIDLFQGLPAGEKPHALAGLEKIASRDVVAVLQGRGLYDESLDSHKPYVQAREEGRAAAAASAKAEAETEAKMLDDARAQVTAAHGAALFPAAAAPAEGTPGGEQAAAPATTPRGSEPGAN